MDLKGEVTFAECKVCTWHFFRALTHVLPGPYSPWVVDIIFIIIYMLCQSPEKLNNLFKDLELIDLMFEPRVVLFQICYISFSLWIRRL